LIASPESRSSSSATLRDSPWKQVIAREAGEQIRLDVIVSRLPGIKTP